MKIGLFTNCNSSLSVNTAKEFEKLLKKTKIEYFNMQGSCEKPDVIVVFGGDGTTVRVVDYAVKSDAPIIVVNTGTLGYLSDFQPNQLEQVIASILNGAIGTELSLLEVVTGDKKAIALNDIVIKKSYDDVLTVIKFSAELNGEKIDDYFADGAIVATPTGSTAYSLSAGGSIITPETKAFIFTPICSHSLSSRAIIYCDSGVIKIKTQEQAQVFVDGKKLTLIENEEVVIKKSDKKLKTFLLKKEFFKRLRQKLNG